MKKIISFILCIAMLASCMGVVYARGEKKSYIVVLDTPAVYSPDRVTTYNVYSMGDDRYRQALLELQAEVRAQIDGGVSMFSLRNQERTYSFTDVINGFTVKVDETTAERIKTIEGVAGVYEDEIIDIVEPVEVEEKAVATESATGETTAFSAANSGNMMNVQSAYDKGYNGKGRAIAIIDSTLNPNHEYYKLSDESTAKYTKADIDAILQNNTLNVSANADTAYRNPKIPYAFNYPQNSYVLSGSNYHGAHVAGIAAGNKVSVSDGVIQGIAPEAQILFFGMYHPNGTPTSAIVAALEDAVKFEVDAINISMGSDFASENHPEANILKTAVASCRNKGVSVAFAAGNSDRMSDLAAMSDYGTSDNRAYRYSSKVGSVQAEYVYHNQTIIQEETAPCESSFSSYGYGDNLDIAVDFAAPGGNIYSSYSGNGYAIASGTSMATPQVTGATSLMYQYVEDNFPAYTGANKVALVKNLLASTAESVYTENGALSSPRKIGAGLIRLDKAMETKVILTGKNSNETKINLGADLGKSFAVTFVVTNLSNERITFNNINVDISADDYKYFDGRGNCYNGRKKLNATVTGANSVAVSGGRSANVTVNVTLSDEDITYLQTGMTNGFFIDGKVTLSGSTNCDVGIPFSGFYGDWSRLAIMNTNRVLDYMKVYGLTEDGFMPPAIIAKENDQLVIPISDNIDDYMSPARVIFMANPLRNTYATIQIDGVTIMQNVFLNKEYDLGYYLGPKTIGDLSDISEITVILRLPYYSTNAKNKSFTIKMVKDNAEPVISDMYVSGEGTAACVVVSDNYGVSTVSAYGRIGEETDIQDAYMGAKSGTARFDIEGREDISYAIYDCAFNAIGFEPHITVTVDSGKAIYTNNTHKALQGDCMIAVYEGDKMTEFKRFTPSGFVMDAYCEEAFDLSEYSGKDYKLFFWKNTGNLAPLCSSY